MYRIRPYAGAISVSFFCILYSMEKQRQSEQTDHLLDWQPRQMMRCFLKWYMARHSPAITARCHRSARREDATAKPKILPPFCAESLAKNHIMIYCLVMLKVMGLQIHGSSKDGIACQRDTASYTYYVYFTYNTVWWNNLEAIKIFPLLCMNRQLQSYSTIFSGK